MRKCIFENLVPILKIVFFSPIGKFSLFANKKNNKLNFIYFTTVMKEVIQLKLIMLVGTDVCVPVVFV